MELQNNKNSQYPKYWIEYRLSEVLSNYKLGGNYKNSEEANNSNIPLIKMGNIGRGNISLKKINRVIVGEIVSDDDILKKGDLLFNTRNTLELVGKVGIWRDELEIAAYNSNLLRLYFNEIIYSNYFMNYCLNSNSSIGKLKRIATGTTSVAAIYTKDLLKVKLTLPSLKEQKKIAQILSKWDEAIETTQNLITQLQLRKKGLMQELLSGEKRLNGFSEKWKKMSIGDVATQFTDKNKDDEEIEVLSCTKYDGLVPSLQYFKRKVYGDDLTKYKIVPRGYFAYATNHIEEGSIGYQDVWDKGLVSPMYTVFKTNDSIDDSFFFRLLKTDKMIYSYQSNMSGSIARRGGLRWSAFENLTIKIPSHEEQIAIAKVFNKVDEEINKVSKYLESLKQQKKGLMQQLLTGQKRVKTEKE